MPGFFVCNRKVDIELSNIYDEHCVKQEIDNSVYTIKRNTLDKFLDDKVFEKFDDYIVLTEGIFLNKQSLCKKQKKTWKEVLRVLIKDNEYDYFDQLRGNFSGGHYNHKTDEWVFYTNPAEEKPVFYYAENGIFMVASEIRYILAALKKLNIEYSVDKNAFYNALTFGFMVSDRTFVKECKKLPYGCYIICKDGKVEVKRYYKLNNETDLLDSWTEDELIEEWDRLFTEATVLAYNKDDEYGYSHVCELSGGIDSRMNTWVAVRNNIVPILNISYTQTDSLDEVIAKQVSQVLNTELMVKSLNSGRMLMDFEEVIKMNYGLTPYPGIAHTNAVLKTLNFEKLGAINTGTFGGVFSPDPEYLQLEGAYSQKLSYRIDKSDLRDRSSENFELYKVRNRELRANVCSQIALYNYSEVLSPFLYRDFVDFYFRIPYDKRKDDAIYIKWIVKKYPDAAKIPVERFQNGLMTDSRYVRKLRRFKQIGLKGTLEWLLWKCHIKSDINREIRKDSMTPYDKWYHEVKNIREVLDSSVSSMIEEELTLNLINTQMADDAKELYREGTTMEKMLVITAVTAIKYLFI